MGEATAKASEKAGIRKVPTGIPGVDAVTGGGIPAGRTTMIFGGPGSGKTILALESLVHGARAYSEPGIFVALEENSQHLIANAASFGWDLEALLEAGGLYILDARIPAESIVDDGYDLSGLLAGLQAKAAEMGAKRIVFDSIEVLLALMTDSKRKRLELYRIHDWLGTSGLSGIITTRVGGEIDPTLAVDYGFMQFMTDCVIHLGHHLLENTSLRTLRVVKYRGSSFAENEFPFVITPTGIEIVSIGIPDVYTGLHYPVFAERLSTGISRLDAMLKGGYIRGTNTLVTGAAGSAKTTLAGTFVQAACERGERVLHVCMDESAEEVVRNLTAVNIHLQQHIDSGLLISTTLRSGFYSADVHLIRIKQLITEHHATCLIVDPLSALLKAVGRITGEAVAQRLLTLAKQQGITTLCTSQQASSKAELETSPLRVSTIADTWIHLTYVINAGERNRALTIIKSRGTGHSNQVRELVMSDSGVSLADVYTAGGEVLMGSLRLEKETHEAAARARECLANKHQQRTLQAQIKQAQSRLADIQREIALHQETAHMVRREQELRDQEWQTRQQQIRDLRSADTPNANQQSQPPPAPDDAGTDRKTP